jgi:hypothetical protein
MPEAFPDMPKSFSDMPNWFRIGRKAGRDYKKWFRQPTEVLAYTAK